MVAGCIIIIPHDWLFKASTNYSQGLGTPLVDFGVIDIHVVMTGKTCPY